MKRKRGNRAKNKIQGSLDGALIKAEPQPKPDPNVPAVVLHSTAVAIPRSTLFATELELAIDVIARERVYRAFLAGLGRRLLIGPPIADHTLPPPIE